MYCKKSDNELIVAIAHGDEEAFNEFYIRYRNWIYKQLINKLANSDEVKDLSQEIWLSVWKNAAAMQTVTDTKRFLYTLLSRQVSDKYRTDFRHETVSMEETPEVFLKPAGQDSDATLVLNDTCRIIEQVLAKCSALVGNIHRLRRDYSVRETAKIAGVSEKRVRNIDRRVKTEMDSLIAS